MLKRVKQNTHAETNFSKLINVSASSEFFKHLSADDLRRMCFSAHSFSSSSHIWGKPIRYSVHSTVVQSFYFKYKFLCCSSLNAIVEDLKNIFLCDISYGNNIINLSFCLFLHVLNHFIQPKVFFLSSSLYLSSFSTTTPSLSTIIYQNVKQCNLEQDWFVLLNKHVSYSNVLDCHERPWSPWVIRCEEQEWKTGKMRMQTSQIMPATMSCLIKES